MAGAAVAGFAGCAMTGSLVVAVAPLLTLVGLALLWRQSLDRLILALLALTLLFDDPAEQPFMDQWDWPGEAVGRVWHLPLSNTVGAPVPFSPRLLLVGLILVLALTRPWSRPGGHAVALLKALGVAVAAVMGSVLWGAARGGNLQQAYFQVFPLLVIVALAVSCCLAVSPELIARIEKVLLIAAVLRAIMCVYLYATVFRPSGESFLYVTNHSDSMLWVVAIAVLAGRCAASIGRQPQRWRVGVMVLLALAIAANNRRIAWVELALVLGYMAWASPPRLHRLRTRAALVVVPLLTLYAVAGIAAPPSRLFAPVQSLVTLNDQSDSSTMSREVENSNLIRTLATAGPLGVGFGHEYVEFVVGDDISELFPQYRYLPHNSILGLWAFGGLLGFTGFMLPFVLGLAGAARLRHSDAARGASAIWLAGAITSFVLMAWGDIGLQATAPGFLGAIAVGLAGGCSPQRGRPAAPALVPAPVPVMPHTSNGVMS